MGKTTLCYYDGKLIAYYTLFSHALNSAYIIKSPGTKDSKYGIKEYPSVAIGRLAVQKDWQRSGIGGRVMKKIVGDALVINRSVAVRLLVVQAKNESITFYEKFGFKRVIERKSEKKRREKGTTTMFYDLALPLSLQDRQYSTFSIQR